MSNAEKLIKLWLHSTKEERETFLSLALAHNVLGNQWVVSTVKDLPVPKSAVCPGRSHEHPLSKHY